MKETFGEYVHRLRITHDLTLTKLAAKLDIDQSTLCKIENNKRRLHEEALPKLSKIFNLNYNELRIEYLSEKIAGIVSNEAELTTVLLVAKEKAMRLKKIKEDVGLIKS